MSGRGHENATDHPPPMPGVRRLGSPYREPWHPLAHNSSVLSDSGLLKMVPSSISSQRLYTCARPDRREGVTRGSRRNSCRIGCSPTEDWCAFLSAIVEMTLVFEDAHII